MAFRFHKQILSLILTFVICSMLLCTCSHKPVDTYQQAYHKMIKDTSYVIHVIGYSNSMIDGATTSLDYASQYEIVKEDSAYNGVCNWTAVSADQDADSTTNGNREEMSGVMYYRDGRFYQSQVAQTSTEESYNDSQLQDGDYLLQFALDNVWDLHPLTILSQQESIDENGRLLKFIIDAKSFYLNKLEFSETTFNDYIDQSLLKDPEYTVLLDQDGRLYKVSCSYRTITESYFTDNSFTTTFVPHDDLQVEYPAL